MKTLNSLLVLVSLSLSVGASAAIRTYKCDPLKDVNEIDANIYVSYTVKVDDGVVMLITEHGSDRGSHYETSSVLSLVSVSNESEVYRGNGIEVRFNSHIEGHKVTNSMTIRDRFKASAVCHEVR